MDMGKDDEKSSSRSRIVFREVYNGKKIRVRRKRDIVTVTVDAKGNILNQTNLLEVTFNANDVNIQHLLFDVNSQVSCNNDLNGMNIGISWNLVMVT